MCHSILFCFFLWLCVSVTQTSLQPEIIASSLDNHTSIRIKRALFRKDPCFQLCSHINFFSKQPLFQGHRPPCYIINLKSRSLICLFIGNTEWLVHCLLHTSRSLSDTPWQTSTIRLLAFLPAELPPATGEPGVCIIQNYVTAQR